MSKESSTSRAFAQLSRASSPAARGPHGGPSGVEPAPGASGVTPAPDTSSASPAPSISGFPPARVSGIPPGPSISGFPPAPERRHSFVVPRPSDLESTTPSRRVRRTKASERAGGLDRPRDDEVTGERRTRTVETTTTRVGAAPSGNAHPAAAAGHTIGPSRSAGADAAGTGNAAGSKDAAGPEDAAGAQRPDIDALFSASATDDDFGAPQHEAHQARHALLATPTPFDDDEEPTEVNDAAALFGESRAALLRETPGQALSTAGTPAEPVPPPGAPPAPARPPPAGANPAPLQSPAQGERASHNTTRHDAKAGSASETPTAVGLPMPPRAPGVPLGAPPLAPAQTGSDEAPSGAPAEARLPLSARDPMRPEMSHAQPAAQDAPPVVEDGRGAFSHAPHTRPSASELAPMSVPAVRAPDASPPPGPPSGSLLYTSNPDTTLISQPAIPVVPPSPRVTTQPAVAPPRAPQRWLWALLGACLLLLGVWAWLQQPAAGTLVVTVAGPANQEVVGVRVFIDERLACERSPCRVDQLQAGPHFLRAEAAGYVPTAKQAVDITAGEETVHNVSLAAKESPAQLEISARGRDLRVFLDGKELGAPPIDIDAIAPGEYVIRVEGPQYEPVEERVVLHAGEVRSVGPLMPRRARATLVLEPGSNAHGASVEFDGNVVGTLPMTWRIDSPREHTLVVRKDGFETIRQTLRFARGEAQKRVTIGLKNRRQQPESPPPPPETPEVAAAPARLELASSPPSTVLVDGRPLGRTPRSIQVEPGSHRVTFIHPQHGRKNLRVQLPAGAQKNVSVRF